jgi:hypothetical protein
MSSGCICSSLSSLPRITSDDTGPRSPVTAGADGR